MILPVKKRLVTILHLPIQNIDFVRTTVGRIKTQRFSGSFFSVTSNTVTSLKFCYSTIIRIKRRKGYKRNKKICIFIFENADFI